MPAINKLTEHKIKVIARRGYQPWSGSKNARCAGCVLARLEADVFRAIGSRPISEILAPELVSMVKAIEKRGGAGHCQALPPEHGCPREERSDPWIAMLGSQ